MQQEGTGMDSAVPTAYQMTIFYKNGQLEYLPKVISNERSSIAGKM